MKHMPVSMTVCEPWEVGEAVGWAPISGEIVGVDEDADRGRALIRFTNPVSHRGVLYRGAIATPKLAGGSITDLLSGARLGAALICTVDCPGDSGVPLDAKSWRGGLALVADIERK